MSRECAHQQACKNDPAVVPGLPGGPDDVVMSIRDVAEEFQVSVPTLKDRVRRGEIPFFRIGRSIRFSRNAVWRFFLNQE